MIRFTKLRAENFMSFRELELDIPSSGLIYFSGENGAGKSSVWEALFWALYGKTVRGVPVDEVVRKGAKGCEVSVEFLVDNVPYLVVRGRNPNVLSIYRNGEDISASTVKATQGLIDKEVGMSHIVFTNSVYFPQNLPYRFIQVSDSEKKAVLDEVLELDWLQEAQERAKGERKEAEVALNFVREELKEAEWGLEATESSYRQMQEKISQVTVEMNELREKSEKFKGMRREVESLRIERERLEEEVKSLEVEVESIQEALTSFLVDELQPRLKKRWELESQYKFVQRRLEELDGLVSSRECLIGKQCPTCGQDVTEAGVKGVMKELKEEKGKFESELSRLEGEVAALSNEISSKESQRKLLVGKEEKVKRLLSEKKSRFLEVGRELDRLLNDVEEEKAVSKALEMRKADLRGLERELKVLGEKKSELESKLQKRREEEQFLVSCLEDISFWVEGFGNRGIKSMLLSAVVPLLNESAAYYSNVLTDGRLKVVFSAVTETKSGTLQERLSVSCTMEDSAPSYAGCSGGERRRADVVVLFALHDLITRFTPSKVNLLILDEVTEALDAEGVERLVVLLQEMARGKAIYVMSHQREMEDFFEEVVRVVKQGGISQLLTAI